MSNGIAAGPSGLVSEMVKPAGDARISMITDLINQIIQDVVPAEWKLSIIVNCCKKREML